MIKDYELKHLLKANIEDFAHDLFNSKTTYGLEESLQIMNEIVDRFVDEYKPEPVKPVLPKAVGEELDIAKVEFPFDVYIGNVIDGVNSAKSSYHYYLDNTNAIIKLADAWRYGWEAEKEALYNVKVPHTEDVWYYKTCDGDLMTISNKKLRSDFTEEEIEHYGLQDCEKEEVTDDEL